MSRNIIALTGIRSEYDILYPALKAIDEYDNLSLDLVVSGAHVANRHNETISYIKNDGFNIVDSIAYLLEGDEKYLRSKGVGELVSSLSEVIRRESPDIILVAGDREEPLAAAIVGNYLDIPVAHIFGGDGVWRNADDPVRHSISKMAHIHLTVCEEHYERLTKMGEQEFRTFEVGNPALDRIDAVENLSLAELSEHVDVPLDNEYLVALQHPLSSEWEHAAEQMRTTMKAITEVDMPAIIVHPNSDPGSEEMIQVIHEYEDYEQVSIHPNFGRTVFINLLRNAVALVGNSSSGILECPYLPLPAVNVGNRQTGRTNAGNVIFVDDNKEEIVETINRLRDNEFRNSLVAETDQTYYGDGNSGSQIADVLADIELSEELLIKRNRY